MATPETCSSRFPAADVKIVKQNCKENNFANIINDVNICSVMSDSTAEPKAPKTVIRVDPASLKDAPPASLHLLPATLEASGPQKVSAFFSGSVSRDGDRGCLTATLRGRPLDGEEVTAPEGHKFAVLHAGGRGQAGVGKSSARTMRATSVADSFTAWNYDKVPSEQDRLRRALDYVDLAEVLHGEAD